mgnify:CR=1 FL=1
MWKNVNGRLIQITDTSRVKFRTNISKNIIDQLNKLALENETYSNYLLETGMQKVLNQGIITFNKDLRPKDRIQYKTTYDKELLKQVKDFAKKNNLYINDVIEYSFAFIDIEVAKSKYYKYRIE